MLDEKVVSRIAGLSLEDAVDELHAVAPTLSSAQSHGWFNHYERLLNDRRAFRSVGVLDAYCGESDGSINDLAQARLKLLSLYIYRGH